MIAKILKMLENLWMTPIKEEQKEYEKPMLLTPNNGSDWRREKI